VLREVSSIEESLNLLPGVPAIYAAWKCVAQDCKAAEQGRDGHAQPQIYLAIHPPSTVRMVPWT
jgi:hypothetical protein